MNKKKRLSKVDNEDSNEQFLEEIETPFDNFERSEEIGFGTGMDTCGD